MGLAEIIALIKGVLEFPGVILQFIKVLKSAPEENHEEILKKIQDEYLKFQETGRPSWD